MRELFAYTPPPREPPPKVFISYATADKGIAHNVKTALSRIKFAAFLAHEDICVSEEWKNRILCELRTMDVFIPILSDAFKISDWAPQETGAAIARKDMLIIPLCVDTTIPFGFIDNIQGKRLPSNGNIAHDHVIQPLSERFPHSVIPQLIEGMKGVRGFRGAESLMEPLVPLFKLFTEEEAYAFATASINNGQIWDADHCANEYLPAFLAQCASQLIPKIREVLEHQITHRKWYSHEQSP